MSVKRFKVKQDGVGNWYLRPYLGRNAVTGEQIRPYKRFPDAVDEADAQAQADAWVDSLSVATGLSVNDALGEMLARYIDFIEAEGASPATVASYRSALRCYVAPYIGSLRLEQVRPHIMDGLYHMLLIKGSEKKKPVSPNTVIKLHWFLSGAFKWFCRIGAVDQNPMVNVDKPSPVKSEATAYEELQFSALSKALLEICGQGAVGMKEELRRCAATAAWLSLRTGMRVGEVCALRVRDVQLMRGTIHVGGTVTEAGGQVFRKPKPKSATSLRNIAIGDEERELLRAHLAWRERVLGDYRADDGDRALLCTHLGGFIRPSAVSREFSKIRDELGLPKTTSFHTLRHTHATYLLYGGVDMRTVQERLGHANVATTLSLYAHVLPGRDAEAVRVFAKAARDAGG